MRTSLGATNRRVTEPCPVNTVAIPTPTARSVLSCRSRIAPSPAKTAASGLFRSSWITSVSAPGGHLADVGFLHHMLPQADPSQVDDGLGMLQRQIPVLRRRHENRDRPLRP